MKNKQIRLLIIAGLSLLVFGFAGCKKNNVEEKPKCRVVKITGPLSTEIFSYDAQGRILSVNYGNFDESFTYEGDSIIKQGTWKSVYALNANGLLAFERREYNSSGTEWETRTYEYDGMQLKKLTAKKSHSEGFTRTYTWSNGNMMLEHTEGNLYTQDIAYEYYMDKPSRPGDVQSWDLLENGVETIRNKNLVKKYSSTFSDYRNPSPTDPPGTPTVEKEADSYTYTFGGDGTISSMTASREGNSNPSTYTYEYQCN
ncbi:hypothetical protein [Niabella hirudinis]|uniref:hypothetical protein n=1 Tax=Niabella hirudinis TaxID=1285929 RepID=UPI003EBFC532